MTYKNIIITLSLLIITGLAVWTTLLSFHPPAIVTVNNNSPDAFMEDVVALIMDKQGKPHMKIVTPKLVHYPEKDTTQLTSPELTLYRNSLEPWFIKSRFATATDGTDYIHFWDNVTIHHAADENNAATFIKTTTLTVFPNKKLAETNQLITLIQPNLLVKSLGMKANMNTGDIKLLSEARGEYVTDQ